MELFAGQLSLDDILYRFPKRILYDLRDARAKRLLEKQKETDEIMLRQQKEMEAYQQQQA